jgi:hypothetical protein
MQWEFANQPNKNGNYHVYIYWDAETHVVVYERTNGWGYTACFNLPDGSGDQMEIASGRHTVWFARHYAQEPALLALGKLLAYRNILFTPPPKPWPNPPEDEIRDGPFNRRGL